MSISEQEALARQLQHIFIEAVGYEDKWDKLDPSTREAWIQVAQFVEAHEKWDIKSAYDKGLNATEYKFSDYEGICPSCLRVIETPDHK